MGYKRTVFLTEVEALVKYAQLKAESMRKTYMAEAILMSKRELESELESLSEDYGSPLDNFSIEG